MWARFAHPTKKMFPITRRASSFLVFFVCTLTERSGSGREENNRRINLPKVITFFTDYKYTHPTPSLLPRPFYARGLAFRRRLSVSMKFSLFYASATSVLKVALYDNQKSKPVSVGCTNIGIFWDCCTAFQSNSSERSAFLLTSGFLVNQPKLTSPLGRAKAGGGSRTLR